MVRKATGFEVSIVTGAKTKRPKYQFIDGNLTKEKALNMAMALATTSNQIQIDRGYDLIDRYGDIECDSKPYGVVKKVKRTNGYAYVIQTFDSDGWESYTYDLLPGGKMTRRR